MEKERIIYALSCPITGEIHYIGKSTQGMIRPLQHMKESHSDKINQWVSDLRFLNYSPIIKILEYVPVSDDIDFRERYWIQYYLNSGCLLLNEYLVVPLIIDPNLDGILDGTYNLRDGQSLDFLKISRFVKEKRKLVNITQSEFSSKTGIALRVIRKVEQGQTNIMLDSLLRVLDVFGCKIEIVKKQQNTV